MIPPASDPPRHGRDLLAALTVFFLLMLWAHRGLLPGGRVNSFWAKLPAAQGIREIYEMVYQELPQWTTARMLKDGRFPSWTPYPEGGTPLLGKMQCGVFSPFHLPLYLLPEKWMPYGFTFIPILTAFFSYCLVYLLGRLLGLRLLGAILAASIFVFFGTTLVGHALFADNAAAAVLPLLLLLVELYLLGFRSLALSILPWAAALPFLFGHFECSIRVGVMTGIYCLARLRDESAMAPADRIRHLGRLGAAGLAGILIASCQILPGIEYIGWSYNKIWRTLPAYGWIYHTIQKRLTWEDVPLLGLGWAALAAGGWLWRRSSPPLRARSCLFLAATLTCLALGAAALSGVGFDDTGVRALGGPARGMTDLYGGGLALLIFSFWAISDPSIPPGPKSLGVLLGLGTAIQLMLPPLSNILAALPVIRLFNNTSYTPEFDLARCLLAAFAVERCGDLGRRTWEERKPVLAGAAAALLVLAGAWGLVQPLKRALARLVPAGMCKLPSSKEGLGFRGPECFLSFGGLHHASGILPSLPGLEAVAVVAMQGEQVSRGVQASFSAASGDRIAFDADFPLERKSGQFDMNARLRSRDGREGFVRGPRVTVLENPPLPLVAAAVAALPLSLLHPWIGPVACAGLTLFYVQEQTIPVVPASQFPYQLPGLERLRRDPTLFRVASFDGDFLSADYPNLYGLHDIRNGGDNLDVRPLIYFLFQLREFLKQPDGSTEQAKAFKLLGLANVKYLLDVPESRRKAPDLEEAYRGPDMVVYRNLQWRERAAFFDESLQMPSENLLDWDTGRRFTQGPVAGWVRQPGFTQDKVLLLHDLQASPEPAPQPASSKEPSVRLEAYEPDRVDIAVDTPRAGFVFLADNFFPGWNATLNGRPAGILRSWLTFRAVAVPAGKSRLEFRYLPARLRAGLLLTLAASLGWVFLYLRYRARRQGLADPPQRTALPKKSKQPAPVPSPGPLPLWTARAVENILLAMVVPCMLYWCVWCGCVYRTGVLDRATAWVILAAGIAGAAWSMRRRQPIAAAQGD